MFIGVCVCVYLSKPHLFVVGGGLFAPGQRAGCMEVGSKEVVHLSQSELYKWQAAGLLLS